MRRAPPSSPSPIPLYLLERTKFSNIARPPQANDAQRGNGVRLEGTCLISFRISLACQDQCGGQRNGKEQQHD